MPAWSGRLLKVWTLFSNDGALYWTDLQADAAIDAGVEIDPVEVCPFLVFSIALVNAGHGAGIHTVGDPLANISDDGMCHGASADLPDPKDRPNPAACPPVPSQAVQPSPVTPTVPRP